MFQPQLSPVSCLDWARALGPSRQDQARRLTFEGVGDADVYNLTAPFTIDGRRLLAGRIERRDTELSQVWLFEETGPDRWAATLPQLRWHHFQDPFVFRLGGFWVLGGVQVTTDPLRPDHIIGWRTLFYRGTGLDDLELWTTSPYKMKDVRMTALADGRTLVLTRPQGGAAGRGQIGWGIADDLDQITDAWMAGLPVWTSHFLPEEWGGANELHLLADGTLGVLGHIARFDEQGNRHYYAMTFRVDPKTGQHDAIVPLAQAGDFLPGPAKRPDLVDVVFPGGLVRRPGQRAELWAGVADARAQVLTVADPWEGR